MMNSIHVVGRRPRARCVRQTIKQCLLVTTLIAVAASAKADELVPPKVYTQTPTGVNLSDGSYLFKETDLSVGDLTLERTHLGGPLITYSRAFGPTWTHNFDIYVRVHPSGAPMNTYFSDVHTAEAAYIFSGDAGGSSITPFITDAYGTRLEKVNGNFRFTQRDGTVYNFSSSVTNTAYERVSSIVYPNGRQTLFSYNGSAQLKMVSDSLGYAIIFDYASNGYVADACAVNRAQTSVSTASTCASISGPMQIASYSYSSVSNGSLLTGMTNRLGQTEAIQYNALDAAKPAVTCVTTPGTGTCKVTNTYGDTRYYYQVTGQVTATGDAWSYSYNGSYATGRAHGDGSTQDFNSTLVTDPTGNHAGYAFVASSPAYATDANGQRTTYYYVGDEYHPGPGSFGSGSYQAEVDLPEGNSFVNGFDDRMNVTTRTAKPKSGSGLSNISWSVGYAATGSGGPFEVCANTDPKVCNQPLWSRDGNGSQTDYTYDSAHGGMLTKMRPRPASGGARPLKVYTYGQQTAAVLNGSASPIWLRASETQCQTVAGSDTPSCDPNAPQMVTSYEYGAAGTLGQLMVQGKVVSSAGVSLRTCYLYDWAGNKIAETSARAGLSSCPAGAATGALSGTGSTSPSGGTSTNNGPQP